MAFEKERFVVDITVNRSQIWLNYKAKIYVIEQSKVILKSWDAIEKILQIKKCFLYDLTICTDYPKL
jgi:hypothetical protein